MSFRTRFLIACGDGRPRTVPAIRAEMGLDAGSNVSEALNNLQSTLAADRDSGIRLRWAGLRISSRAKQLAFLSCIVRVTQYRFP